MILTLAILIGLAATALRARLCHRKIQLPRLRLDWLVLISVIPQIVTFQIPQTSHLIPDHVVPAILTISSVGLLVFALANIFVPGFWAFLSGLAMNFMVILLNGGWMPVNPDTIRNLRPDLDPALIVIGNRVNISKDQIMLRSDTYLSFLADQLYLPPWFPYKFVFSVGDVLISVGAFLLLWSLSSEKQ
jgi:hypothetical protein